MIKLGLIGRNISHSKSQLMYEGLLGTSVDYTLLDYGKDEDIPKIKELIRPYRGLSITTPYKETFIDQIDEIEIAVKELAAINCMMMKNGALHGTNTDFLALKELLGRRFQKNPKTQVIVLGDGVMSRVTQKVLDIIGGNYSVISRKRDADFSQLNLVDRFSRANNDNLCINCCSRDYVYQGPIDDSFYFWDLNYSFQPHQDRFNSYKKSYQDGLELLNKQAEHALKFWGIIT